MAKHRVSKHYVSFRPITTAIEAARDLLEDISEEVSREDKDKIKADIQTLETCRDSLTDICGNHIISFRIHMGCWEPVHMKGCTPPKASRRGRKSPSK